jgi:aminoglycoside phosphotransferase (APT) family kinase protein
MTWRPEIAVGTELATKLIHSQFPERIRVEPLAEGWDYSAFRVDERFVFRFPRRAVVLPGMAREMATLPLLNLPVMVPTPLFVGEPTSDFPWPFFGAPYIAGDEPLDSSDEERRSISMALARTLRALHAHDPADLPEDANQRADMSRRVPWARQALAEIGVDAERILAPAESLPVPRATALCHGDLHVRQILAEGGTLNGIIDWVDVCRGDPGIDLSLLWSFVPRQLFDEFIAEYGAVQEGSLQIARVLALGLNATLANYARNVGSARLERAALTGVANALGD